MKFTDDGRTWTATRTPKQRIGIAVFFTFWLAIWGGGGGFFALVRFNPTHVGYWLLVLSWAGATGLGVFMLWWTVLGDATLVMSHGRVRRSLRYFPFAAAKEISLADVTQVDLYAPTHRNGQLKMYPALRIETADDAITFGRGATSAQIREAIAALRKQLSRRGGCALPPTRRLDSIPAHHLQTFDGKPGSKIASLPMTAASRRWHRGFEVFYAVFSVGWFTMLGLVGVAALIRSTSDGNGYEMAFGALLVLLGLLFAGVPTGVGAYRLLRWVLVKRKNRNS